MTAEQTYEKDWAVCSLCGCRRPRRDLYQLEAPAPTGVLGCFDVDWCARQRKAVRP